MATEYGGYMGKILLIDLATETTEEYPFTDQQRRDTLGGKMLADHILSHKLTVREHPFSEENLIILSTGPLTGTGVPVLYDSILQHCPQKQDFPCLPIAEAASVCI